MGVGVGGGGMPGNTNRTLYIPNIL
jgi:hypothetical protein